MSQKIDFPIIINKYVALKKLASRKEADRLLKAHKIWVNGKLAEPGQLIGPDDQVRLEHLENYRYAIFHKPEGVITHSPQVGEDEVADYVQSDVKLAPIGRLDKDSSGLLLLTNDGRVTERLLHPDFYHEKEYDITINKDAAPDLVRRLAAGVVLDDGYETRPCKVRKIDARHLRIILTEGKKRQIRRMLEVLGYRVRTLHRLRIMNLSLGDLPEGHWRFLAPGEAAAFLKSLGL